MVELAKPDTLRSNRLKEWIRVHFLSPYLWEIPENERTLDLACGWGFSFKINPNFYGIEYDDACVSYLREKHDVRKGNLLESFPFEDGFFDNCFSHDVLEHFEAGDLDAIFRHVHRVLKPNGLFMNIIPNRLGYDFGLRINAGHKHFVTPDELARVAARTGFSVESVHASPLPKVFHKVFVHNKWVVRCRKS